MQTGDFGPEVGNWQRFLIKEGCYDWNLCLSVDEIFGPKTTYATKQWQTKSGMSPTGTVTIFERARAREFIPFVQAKHCLVLYPSLTRKIDVITIHTMESSEKPRTAKNIARWFSGPVAPMASAHYCIDPDITIQCVRDTDVAWHAPGCNHNGIGIEHAGSARQTIVEWADDASLAILTLSAKLCARLLNQNNIPNVKLTPEDLISGKRGICGHADATKAFPGPGRTHTDPGSSFPWVWYIALVGQQQTL